MEVGKGGGLSIKLGKGSIYPDGIDTRVIIE